MSPRPLSRSFVEIDMMRSDERRLDLLCLIMQINLVAVTENDRGMSLNRPIRAGAHAEFSRNDGIQHATKLLLGLNRMRKGALRNGFEHGRPGAAFAGLRQRGAVVVLFALVLRGRRTVLFEPPVGGPAPSPK